jgi:hypothetical protein
MPKLKPKPPSIYLKTLGEPMPALKKLCPKCLVECIPKDSAPQIVPADFTECDCGKLAIGLTHNTTDGHSVYCIGRGHLLFYFDCPKCKTTLTEKSI